MHLDAFVLLNQVYLLSLLPIAAVTLAVAWFWRRATVRRHEYLVLLLPGMTYWYLWDVLRWELAFPGKTMGNLVVEPFLLALIVGALLVCRLVLAVRHPRKAPLAIALFLLASNGSAVAVHLFTPGIPVR